MSDIKNFFDQLDQANNEEMVDVYVPSQNKDYKFKFFSVKQHKDIIKTAMEGFDGNIKANIILNDIITTNCTQPVDFKLYDRTPIIIKLRGASISNKVFINNKEYNIADLPQYKFDFAADPIITYNNIVVTLEIPTLQKDTQAIEKSLFEFSKITTDEKKVKDAINILLTYEIIKFIKDVKIDDISIVMDSLNFLDKKTLVEKLPLKLNNKIIDFISKYKEHEQKALTFADGARITLDAGFLASE